MSRVQSRQGGKTPSEIRDVSKTLSNERRDKLLGLRDREAMKDVLTEKFHRRYGSQRDGKGDDDAQSVSESVIRGEVQTFVQKGSLTEGNLARLERRIRQHSRKPGQCPDDMKSVVSSYSRMSGASEGNHSVGMRSNLGSICEGSNQYDWAKLDEYAKYLYEQDAKKQKAGVADQQRKLRSDLDQQVQDARLRKEKEMAADEECWKESMNLREADLEKERQKDEDRKKKINKEAQDRRMQLLYEQELKESEAEKKRVDEEALVRKIADEVLSEKERGQQRKQDQRDHLKKVFEENEQEKLLKKEAQDRQKEEDIEYSRKYREMLDAQDRQKQQELQNRLTRQKQRVDAMEKNVMGVVKKKEEEAAERAAQQRKEMEARLLELERNKQENMTKQKQETQQFLLQQMKEHDTEKQNQRHEKQEQGKLLEVDSETYNNNKQRETETRRIRNIKHREELQQQINERNKQATQGMSMEEIAMNKELLQKVDKTLRERGTQ